MQTLVADCRRTPSACDENKVGSDDLVKLPGTSAGTNNDGFEVQYGWLRSTLRSAHDPAMKDRDSILQEAGIHLQEEVQEAQFSPGSSSPDLTKARRDTDTILRRTEFLTVKDQSIWERLAAKIFAAIDRLFGNVAMFGQRSPWIGPLFEWGLIVLALLGLTLWAMLALRRQRLHVRMEAARQFEPWEEASRNWRAQAAEQAERQDWREAVHCLYWASIVMLEGRSLWHPNRSRTPREYLRLLEAGSPRWTLLRDQTKDFERIWYGLYPAQANDYQSALQLHEQLRTA